MNEQEWTREFQDRKALWVHDGDPRRPHVLLPSGRHSNVHFDPAPLLQDGLLLNRAARDLVSLLREAGLSLEDIDLLVSPLREAGSSADLAWHMSGLISSTTGKRCLHRNVARENGPTGPKFDSSMPFDWERVLLVEDEITADTVAELAQVAFMDGKPLLFIAALMNASGDQCVYGTRQIGLVSHKRLAWDDGECPLCKMGSKAMRPENLLNEWLDAA